MCVFCKIVDGSIPSYKIYEDQTCLAFLDISQVTLGHCLVIPKKHFENIFEIDEKTASILFENVVKIAKMLKQNLNVENINILNNNGKLAYQSVIHFHIHLIPRSENDNFTISFPTNKLTQTEFIELKEKITKK